MQVNCARSIMKQDLLTYSCLRNQYFLMSGGGHRLESSCGTEFFLLFLLSLFILFYCKKIGLSKQMIEFV